MLNNIFFYISVICMDSIVLLLIGFIFPLCLLYIQTLYLGWIELNLFISLFTPSTLSVIYSVVRAVHTPSNNNVFLFAIADSLTIEFSWILTGFGIQFSSFCQVGSSRRGMKREKSGLWKQLYFFIFFYFVGGRGSRFWNFCSLQLTLFEALHLGFVVTHLQNLKMFTFLLQFVSICINCCNSSCLDNPFAIFFRLILFEAPHLGFCSDSFAKNWAFSPLYVLSLLFSNCDLL